MSSCASDKAPGPDGFSLAFFQLCWDTIKGELMEAIEYFHMNGAFERSINAFFITIVPKKEGASCIRDYRPINAFVESRQILDAALVANELVDSRKKNREPGLLCKLDLEKAFDHLQGSQVLQWFQIVSGRKINLVKCEIFPVGEVANIDVLSHVLECKLGSLPTTCLGLPLGALHKDTTVWNPVIQRVEKRLAGWQKRYLSKGGKEVLIKSTLSSIPTYYLSLLQAHMSITEKLERLQRNFLWDAADGTRKFHLVN
uniref:Reverse transcriptase domain-containing protein n=1 Tax=Nicotiana tabacum TaxID=4097 RepID=A0A1S4D4D8_TOBAC|nr:PREDICTED: uncharacterized protein LOC107825833 [Nicotiana tabacum]